VFRTLVEPVGDTIAYVVRCVVCNLDSRRWRTALIEQIVRVYKRLTRNDHIELCFSETDINGKSIF